MGRNSAEGSVRFLFYTILSLKKQNYMGFDRSM